MSQADLYYNSTVTSLFAEGIHKNSANFDGQEIKDYGKNLSEAATKEAKCNETIYFVCPDPDPLFTLCTPFNLQADLEVNGLVLLILVVSRFITMRFKVIFSNSRPK